MLPCAPMESFLRQSVGVALPVRLYICVFLFLFDHVCEHVLGNSSLLWARVCSKYKPRWFSWKHLSHSLDCFTKGSILSFAPIRGIRPREFRVHLNSYAGVEFVNHLAPQLESAHTSECVWDWIKWDNGDMTNLNWTMTHMFTLVELNEAELYRAAWG